MDQKKRILVLAPHTDDGELGCGASIAQFAEAGKEIFYVAFSICSRSLPSHLPPDTLKIEAKNATQALGIKPENIFFKDYDVRRFKEFRQDILEDLVKMRAELKPDLVFLPASQDIHQDHQVIAEEGFRAFKNTS
ncbi:MAG TPA: PIG-L family deacetylase, partial [Cyclobacteriaceae bacterium]